MKNLNSALISFQSECPSISFDSINPHFKSRFASLAAIHKVIDPILSKHGLGVMQFPVSEEDKAGVVTRVIHASGEYIEYKFTVPLSKHDPQGACAAVSYARRYGISGALCLVTEEDDDGESASGRGSAPVVKEPRRQRKAPAMSAESRDKVKHAASLRASEIGDDISATEIIVEIAKRFGYSSPIELLDSDLGRTISAIQEWEPK